MTTPCGKTVIRQRSHTYRAWQVRPVSCCSCRSREFRSQSQAPSTGSDPRSALSGAHYCVIPSSPPNTSGSRLQYIVVARANPSSQISALHADTRNTPEAVSPGIFDPPVTQHQRRLRRSGEGGSRPPVRPRSNGQEHPRISVNTAEMPTARFKGQAGASCCNSTGAHYLQLQCFYIACM